MSLNNNGSAFFNDKGLNITPTTSVDCFNSNNDRNFTFGNHSSNFNATGYNSDSGYGLVNAGAAVGKAIGQEPLSDVPDLGGNNWGADMVKAPASWANGYTGQGVVVAVLDTGVDYNHQDLKNNIWTNSKEIGGNGIDDDGDGYVDDVYGWNFADNDNNTIDTYGHGTHVAGTIAGENNNFGVTGIAYDAKIMPVKVLGNDGSGSYSAIAQGIRYAVDRGANVINLSLGGDYPNSTLESAIEYADSKNVTVVMAAGNNGDPAPAYPARYANKHGIAVGAVDKNKNMASYSDRAGSEPLSYVTAPGSSIYSTVPGDKYATYSGTSMASPHVAGVVGLMLSANPNLTSAQIRQMITETAGNSLQTNSTSSYTNEIYRDSNFSVSYPTQSNSPQYQNNTTEIEPELLQVTPQYQLERPLNYSPSSTVGNDEMLLNSELWSEFNSDYVNF
ncbi:MAG: S8 family peptidase [Cyanomargarita calcarea GSE-NOS-MK-12-04C]|jgi:subtilisin family serine protease|uniref:S8 family peptidase n=1 Tax=Cyanomargarita calcarea GSE-NOS-MK-12-04C TaxID=2839659 RepID=A0A951V0F6_9CYAN|nr:S8 family peptidase [Cyanomargarita calcarea GSE-NOS-MK-12-04C]